MTPQLPQDLHDLDRDLPDAWKFPRIIRVFVAKENEACFGQNRRDSIFSFSRQPKHVGSVLTYQRFDAVVVPG